MKWKMLCAILAFTMGFVLSPVIALEEKYTESTYLKAGDKVPEFELTDLDGNTLTADDLLGKVTYINFFATWCGPCNSEWPYLEENLWQTFKGDPHFQMISVGREHSKAELVAFKRDKKIESPLAPDPERRFYGMFAEKYIPRGVITGRDGTILYQSVGYDGKKLLSVQRMMREELAKISAS